MMQVDVRFGAIVRPVRQGQPFTDQKEIIKMQQSGKLPLVAGNTAHFSHPTDGFYIVTPPDLDQMPLDATLLQFLTKAVDVEV
jgi:hypothetical protein